jgi:hypothetical protein
MKATLLFSAILLSVLVQAEEPKAAAPAAPTTPKMTTKDAKKTCKEEGKTGAELIQCMKDKKEEK